MNNKKNTENVENPENDIKTLTQEEFSKYIKEIPVTTDNWKEYVTIESKEKQNFDSFGEVTRTYYQPYAKIEDNNVYGYLLLEVKVISSDIMLNDGFTDTNIISVTSGRDSEIYIPNHKDNAMCTANDLQCTRIKGNLYTIDLPEDIWGTKGEIIIETSEKYREHVHGNNEAIIISKDTYIEDLGIMINMENMDSTY